MRDDVDRRRRKIIDGREVEDSRVFDIMEDWNTAALDPGVWINVVCGRGSGL